MHDTTLILQDGSPKSHELLTIGAMDTPQTLNTKKTQITINKFEPWGKANIHTCLCPFLKTVHSFSANFWRMSSALQSFFTEINIVYRPQRSWGKVIFSQTCVILFTGGSASVHARIPPLPPEQEPPGSRHPPPGPGTVPGAEHAGRYGQRAGGTHPTGMQSCSVKGQFSTLVGSFMPAKQTYFTLQSF